MWEKSKGDINEEETKIQKNLSRLIHTLQHFPSKRSGLDTTSLWNLVEELESFNPERKTKSLQFTQTTERKTFSKKYLNLHISGGNEKRTNTPEFIKTNTKPKNVKPVHKSSEKSPGKNINKFNENDFQRQKKTASSSYGSYKDKVVSGANGRKNNGTIFKKGKEKEGNKNCLKEPGVKVDKCVNFTNKKLKTYQSPKEKSCCRKQTTKDQIKSVNRESRLIKQNGNKMVNFKCKSHQCTPKSNKALQEIILDNNKSSIDKSSVVKKLTNYWNNLLNNECEQNSSSTESSEGSCQNVGTQDDSSKGIFNKNETQRESSCSTLKSRHLSESNINIMKRTDDLHSNRIINTVSNLVPKPSNQVQNPTTDSDPVDPSSTTTNKDFLTILKDKDFNNFDENCQFTLFSTNIAIPVLQGLLNEIKQNPICNIQPLTKKMLYVTVASSMLTSQHENFLQRLEVFADKMIQIIVEYNEGNSDDVSKEAKVKTNMLENDIPVGHILSAFNNNFEIDMDYICKNEMEKSDITSPQKQDKSSMIKSYGKEECMSREDQFAANTSSCETTYNPGMKLTLLSTRIDFKQVKNALNLFSMWREAMWSSESNNAYEDFGFPNCNSPQYHSFTIIYEEDIIFEEESDDEDSLIQDSSESECKTMLDMCTSAFTQMETYIDKVIDILENYYPDSPEIFIRMVYHGLVSILVWWIIINEIFVK